MDKEKKNAKPSKKLPISKREIEVLKLLACELSNKEIADKIFISTRTVESHRRNTMKKLNVKNLAGLIRYAVKEGLIEMN